MALKSSNNIPLYTTKELMKLTDDELKKLLTDEWIGEDEVASYCRASMIEKLLEIYTEEDNKNLDMSTFTLNYNDTWQVSFDKLYWYEVPVPYSLSKEAISRYLLNSGAVALLEKWATDQNIELNEQEQVTIYIGQFELFKPKVDVNMLLNNVNAAAWDYSGNEAEGYLQDVSAAAKEELSTAINDVFANWLIRNELQSDLSTINNIQSFSLPYWSLKTNI